MDYEQYLWPDQARLYTHKEICNFQEWYKSILIPSIDFNLYNTAISDYYLIILTKFLGDYKW